MLFGGTVPPNSFPLRDMFIKSNTGQSVISQNTESVFKNGGMMFFTTIITNWFDFYVVFEVNYFNRKSFLSIHRIKFMPQFSYKILNDDRSQY